MKSYFVKASEAGWPVLDRVIGRAQGVDKAVELPVFCVIKVMAALAAVISRTNGPEARRSPRAPLPHLLPPMQLDAMPFLPLFLSLIRGSMHVTSWLHLQVWMHVMTWLWRSTYSHQEIWTIFTSSSAYISRMQWIWNLHDSSQQSDAFAAASDNWIVEEHVTMICAHLIIPGLIYQSKSLNKSHLVKATNQQTSEKLMPWCISLVKTNS